MDIAEIDDATTAERRRLGLVDPSLTDLFMGFLSVAITAFGGVMPIARRMLIERRRWISSDEFNELLAFCQFLPGPNIGNMSIAIGGRFHGPLGALVACLGLMVVPCGIVIVLTTLYEHFSEVQIIRHVFIGVAATACGIIFATAAKMAQSALKRRLGHGLLFIAVTIVTIGLLRWELVLTLVALLPLSVLAFGKQPWFLKPTPKAGAKGGTP